MRKLSFSRAMLGCFMGVVCLAPARSQSTYAYAGRNKQALQQKSLENKYGADETPQKQTLFTVLKELNATKGIYFLFSEQSLGDKLVNPLEGNNDNVEKILGQVLKNTGLKFKKINDKTFVILPGKEAAGNDNNLAGLTLAFTGNDPGGAKIEMGENIVAGKVTSADGKPLEGVSVTIKRSKKGVSTDISGVFAIDANKGDILIFSFIGYKSKEVLVGDAAAITVTLEASKQQLTEVVVTALGIKKQTRSLGYSTTEVDGSKFTSSREANIGNALTGQVAGVSVAGVATGPSGSSRVLIRGNGSLSGQNQPLYVIDGIPYDNTNQGYAGKWGGADFGDGLSNLNPDDIESIQVLKGVAASALYGYRGGNGAILISTKSGTKSHGLGIEVNNNLTANSIIDEREYQYSYGQGVQGVKPITATAAQNAEYYSWGAKMDGSQATNFLGTNYAYSPAKDNFKHFYNTGLVNQASVALTGSNEQGHFRLGLSDLYNGTVIPNSNMKQQGINFNSGYNITPKLQLNLTANYIFEQVKNRVSFSDAPGNVVASNLYLANTFDVRWLKPAIQSNGNELLPGADLYFNNPYFVAEKFQNSTSRQRFTGGVSLKYNILDWLYVQTGVTRDGYIFDLKNIVPNGTGYDPGGQITVNTVNYHELNGNFLLGINKKFGSDFTVNASLGGNSQDNVTSSAGVTGAGPFIIPYFYSLNNVSTRPYTIGYQHYRVNSFYGTADFGYKNYLFLNVTARNDWFSTLNPQSNHYLYPSASASFVFSDAFKLPDWISFGKVRASYARGSNGTSPYLNSLTYGFLGYTIDGQSQSYVVQNVVPNKLLSPVKIEEKEVGLSMQFLNNRVGFDAAWYDKNTTADIVNVTVSPTSGYNGNVENIGKIRNRGLELLLTGTPVKTHDFSWNVSFNIAQNNSKVLRLGPDGSPIVVAGAFPRWGNGVNVSNVVGLPYGQIMGYGYKRDKSGNKIFSDGVTSTLPAGEPIPTDALIPLGSGVYKQTGGFSNDFHYKDFSLSFLIDFKYGAKIYSGTNLLLYNYGLQKTTLQGRVGGYIGKGVLADGHPNTTAVNAQTYFQDLSVLGDQIAEEFVYDASFIKLRSLSLAYSFPHSILKSGFIKGVSISLVARNIATLMKHTPNIDPESNLNNTNGQGLELSGYPAVRSMGVNVNLKF
ncbi:MAG TPA: SusC/RagA family TonB-linked outer membrane protein [Puia sp.]|nr:SusC/RagA family TonB-linked outer membrane protein [Puia sp.]